jgi:hypothetical protein
MKKKPNQRAPAPPLPLAPRYVDEIEAARYLSIARKSLQNWRLRGVGPKFVRLEGSIRYSIHELTTYAENRVAQSLAEADRHDAERKAMARAEEVGHG